MQHRTQDSASNGQARRRTRTHEALLLAGRELLARGQEDASIEEITRLAGVGFGSFTNHFPGGKPSFFHEAALEVLSELGERIGAAAAEYDDPVDAVAAGFRATIMMARSEPSLRAVLLRPGTDVLFAAGSLLRAAGADVERGIAEGVFVDDDPQVLVVGLGSVLIGTLRLLEASVDENIQRGDARRDGDRMVASATAAALRLLGTEPNRARRAARQP